MEAALQAGSLRVHPCKQNSMLDPWAVVVAQLAELPIPEVRFSNPDTGKFLQNIYLLSTVLY